MFFWSFFGSCHLFCAIFPLIDQQLLFLDCGGSVTSPVTTLKFQLESRKSCGRFWVKLRGYKPFTNSPIQNVSQLRKLRHCCICEPGLLAAPRLSWWHRIEPVVGPVSNGMAERCQDLAGHRTMALSCLPNGLSAPNYAPTGDFGLSTFLRRGKLHVLIQSQLLLQPVLRWSSAKGSRIDQSRFWDRFNHSEI